MRFRRRSRFSAPNTISVPAVINLTIFSIPAPFVGPTLVRQVNAIRSWIRLGAGCEIVLLGDDDGVADAAASLDVHHVGGLGTTDLGTPLMDDAFRKARHVAAGRVLMYSNCDMLYFADLLRAIESVTFDGYMMCGRRWDTDIGALIPADNDEAWNAVSARHGRIGRWHGWSGLDFFIFPRSFTFDMKPFAVGRPGWDTWLVWSMRHNGVPVIDATGSVTAIHQNHDYAYLRLGPGQYNGAERLRNIDMAGGLRNMMTLREADWVLRDGRVRRPPLARRLLAAAATHEMYRRAIGRKRRAVESLQFRQ